MTFFALFASLRWRKDLRFELKAMALIVLVLGMPAWGTEIPPSTVVRFNTVCANCHEGECSGRLSFQSGVDAAKNHIRRYLGALSEREVGDLFALLKYTKEKCRQYPVKPEVPASGRWGARELESWRNPVEGGYFIPLGALKPGEHRLNLNLTGDLQGKARVTDAHFEIAAEERLCRGREPALVFTVSGGEYYLHVQTQAKLLGLELDQRRY